MAKNKIKLLVISSVMPHVKSNFEAANVILHSILSELINSNSFELTYMYVNSTLPEIPMNAKSEIDELKDKGVKFLDPLLLEPNPPLHKHPFKLIKAFFFKPEAILYGHGEGKKLLSLLNGHEIDAVMPVWSELGSNIASELPFLRFAYNGNPENKVFDAYYEIMRLANVQPKGIRFLFYWMRYSILSNILKRAHIAILRRYNFVADVGAIDAADYKSHGINAFYLQNMWPINPPADWVSRRDNMEANNLSKIVGNVGNTSATGNSLGFIALTQEVLPALKTKLDLESFKIHIFGGREPRDYLKPLLNDTQIVLRGFVDDLDAEIMSAPVFMVLNNRYNFQSGHTRFLHAWSLGACVIAFDNCSESMPEIKNGYNALLGSSSEEIADLIVQALSDRDLRRRIGQGGVDTLKSKFHPSVVTKTLVNKIKQSF
jgi:glycosyltransferase involved in cell wall biosynthesis